MRGRGVTVVRKQLSGERGGGELVRASVGSRESVDGGIESSPEAGVGRKADPLGRRPLAALFTTDEIAAYLRVHPKTVERLRRQEGLPCLRIGGSVRYDLSAVISWASARQEVR